MLLFDSRNHEITDVLALVLYFLIANASGYAILEWKRDNYKVIFYCYVVAIRSGLYILSKIFGCV